MTMTDLDFTVLEDLEFEVPCEITYTHPSPGKCTAAAVWLIYAHLHCTPATKTQLLCAAHYDYMVNGGDFYCTLCKAVGPMVDQIIRTERIRS